MSALYLVERHSEPFFTFEELQVFQTSACWTHKIRHVACVSIRVELSQVELLDLSQTNYFETICEELFSSIKNENDGIEDDQTLSVQVWFKSQWTRDLLWWSVPSSEALSGSGMCEDRFAGDDAPYAVCPSIGDNPEMPGTMDQKRQ